MNAQRRKDIAKAIELLEEARAIIDIAAEEEREAYDNIPDNLNLSDRALKLEENADNLEEVSSELEDQISNLTDIIDN